MRKIVLFGAGGHARVLIDALQSDQQHEVCALVDNDRRTWNTEILGVPVVGDESLLQELMTQGVNSFGIALGSINRIALRRKLYAKACDMGLHPCPIRHPSAICSPHARIGNGIQMLAQSVVNPGTVLGDGVVVNTGAIIEHDCQIDAHVHLAPRVCLAGGVSVGAGTHIGLGAVVRENVSIGKDVIVGAGAVVLHDVPEQSVVVGVPAKPILRKEAA